MQFYARRVQLISINFKNVISLSWLIFSDKSAGKNLFSVYDKTTRELRNGFLSKLRFQIPISR